MVDSDSLMGISDDEQDIRTSDEEEARLYIDENRFDSVSDPTQQTTKATNTGNAFELDLILLAYNNRYQTRASQTILMSDTSVLFKRHRSTICQVEYFITKTQGTNTVHNEKDTEECIAIVKKQRTDDIDLLVAQAS